MVFENYAIKDNAYGLLNSSINASTTTITLQTGNGANFPTIGTKKSVLTIVQYNTVGVPSSGILKFEKILCTLRSGDILTVQRGYDGTTATTFNSGDSVYLNITTKVIEDIQNELVDLENTKQNNCVMVTKSANYTFVGTEANNAGFSTTTTSGNITYTLNPALFPTTNGMYEFTICKSTNDANTVIIDVGAGKTIDTVQTYILTNFMESVTIRIASSTFVKVIAATNRTVVVPAISTTQSTFIAGENITAGNVLRKGFTGEISGGEVIISQNTQNTEYSLGFNTTVHEYGQGFTATKTGGLKNIGLYLRRNGTASYQYRVKVYSNSSFTTLIGTSNETITLSDIPATPATLYNFTFNNITITNTTIYYFKIERVTGSADVANFLSVQYNTTGGYAGGNSYSLTNGGVVTSIALEDLRFSLVLGDFEDTSKVYKTDASNSSKINFIGFATNTVSTGNNVIVDTSGVSATQSGLTTGSDYYLSNTAGAISTTPGTNIVSVGKAVSATGIEINNSDRYNNSSYLLKTDTIQITRDTSVASNTVTYNHGLGKIPKLINIESYFRNNNGTFNSSGTFANSKNQCTYLNYNGSAYSILSDTSNCVRVSGIGGSAETYGYINNLTTTTFDIVWTKVNASTGILNLQISLIA